jgi:putative phosphoserine phosphatase/1-acylglycerol-3-phosphate O-acyltransferase
MSDTAWLLDRVEQSAQGPQVAAFFAFDKTIVDCFSASIFFKPRTRTGDIGFDQLMKSITGRRTSQRRGRDISEIIRIGASAQAGIRPADLRRSSREIYEEQLAALVFGEARMLIEAHHRMGHTVVIASPGLEPMLRPAADDLGIRQLVATEMVIDDYERYSGALATPVLWGEEKASAVKQFAAQHDVSLTESFSYASSYIDTPMLETVGNPCVINADATLQQTAGERKWSSATLLRPPRDTPASKVRSVAALGAFGAAIAAAAGVGIAAGSRTAGANFASSIGSDLSLKVAGVDLKVVGEENLWARRPAVFLFNHQSQIDVFVLGSLLRENFTGVAKKSLEKDPLFGPVGWLANVAFIDRSNNAEARKALEPVVEALQSGRSIAIAPEGTRSPTPRLLPFKKGPFHIAMQAEVPLVPIVMRNCGEIMASHSFVVHPGVLDVAVLPPVETKGWTKANLDQHIAEVRQMYLDTLSNWPGKS